MMVGRGDMGEKTVGRGGSSGVGRMEVTMVGVDSTVWGMNQKVMSTACLARERQG
jgi:hypothetical protein